MSALTMATAYSSVEGHRAGRLIGQRGDASGTGWQTFGAGDRAGHRPDGTRCTLGARTLSVRREIGMRCDLGVGHRVHGEDIERDDPLRHGAGRAPGPPAALRGRWPSR